MIDTVRYTQKYTVLSPLPPHWKKNWKCKHVKRKTKSFPTCYDEFKHLKTGLNARFHGDGHVSVQVSLPRLIFNRNSKLLISQKEVNKALEAADKLLHQIGSKQHKLKEFQRVDLAWQVRGKMPNIIFAYRNIKHPKIHGLPILYKDETIMWKGREMHLSIYDKVREREKKPGIILRIEILLRGGKLKRELGNKFSLTHLDFLKCYNVFREKIISFPPILLPPISRPPTKDDILRLALENKWLIGGQSAFDFLLEGYSKQRRQQKHRKFLSLKSRLAGINWEKEFPLGKPNKVFRGEDYDFSYAPHRFKFKW